MSAQIASIRDTESGAAAKILVSQGLNCFEFQVPSRDDPLDVIWSEPEFEQGDKRASGSGNPLLFPFPGRIAGTQLQWDGKTYALEAGDGRGNAIHGFVHQRPWRVLAHDPARLVGQFQASVDDPSLLQHWPTDFRITATYQVQGTCLSSSFLLENPDDHPLPCGFGTHPYFALGLGSGTADHCVVKLPVSSSWELSDMNATGKKTPLEDPSTLQRGLTFGELNLDHVFSDLVFNGGICEASIADPESGRTLAVSFDRAFRECVVYTPPHRQAICIEPYTCVPDPFRLEPLGVNAGLRVLAPGESFQAHVDMRVT
jgi:aldose 1-epimerase